MYRYMWLQEQMEARKVAAAAGAGSPLQPLSPLAHPRRRSAGGGLVVKGDPRVGLVREHDRSK